MIPMWSDPRFLIPPPIAALRYYASKGDPEAIRKLLALGLPLREIYTKDPERETAAWLAWLREDRKRQIAARDKQENSTGTESQQKRNLEMRLVYRGDFCCPDTDNWPEGTSETGYSKTCRQDGYYYIAVCHPPLTCWHCPELPITDFRVHVDASFTRTSGEGTQYGVAFRQRNDGDHYRFTISRYGSYALHLYANGKCNIILDFQSSEFIGRDDSINSLMVKVVGQKITLGINGHILGTAMDSTLTTYTRWGTVGLFVSALAGRLVRRSKIPRFSTLLLLSSNA